MDCPPDKLAEARAECADLREKLAEAEAENAKLKAQRKRHALKLAAAEACLSNASADLDRLKGLVG